MGHTFVTPEAMEKTQEDCQLHTNLGYLSGSRLQKQNKSTKPTTCNSYQKKLPTSQHVLKANKKPGARQGTERFCSLSSAKVGKMGCGAPNQRGSAHTSWFPHSRAQLLTPLCLLLQILSANNETRASWNPASREQRERPLKGGLGSHNILFLGLFLSL